MRFYLSLVLISLTGGVALAVPPQPTTDEVVRGIETTYEDVQSLRAEFVQTTRSAALGEGQKQRGRMEIKRPSKMRWDFQRPEPRLFVTNGKRMWVYSPSENQAILYEDQAMLGSGVQSLLTDLQQLDEQFTVREIEDPEAKRVNNVVLELTPKAENANFKSLRLELTRKKYLLKRLVLVDAFDTETELSFTQVRLNTAMDDSVFEFQPPAGVEVIKPAGF